LELAKNLKISFLHHKSTAFELTNYFFNFKKLTFRQLTKKIDEMHF